MESSGIGSTNGSIATTLPNDQQQPPASWKKALATVRRQVQKIQFCKIAKNDAFWHILVKNAGLWESVLPKTSQANLCSTSLKQNETDLQEKAWPRVRDGNKWQCSSFPILWNHWSNAVLPPDKINIMNPAVCHYAEASGATSLHAHPFKPMGGHIILDAVSVD